VKGQKTADKAPKNDPLIAVLAGAAVGKEEDAIPSYDDPDQNARKETNGTGGGAQG
jgi:hypothetical protein